jgi:hypothetical protein
LRFSRALRSLGAGLLLAFVVAVLAVGVARAAQASRTNDQQASIGELRSLVDHYRALAWTYQRAGHVRRTPTSFSYRRTSDRSYLKWSLDIWTRRAYAAEGRALTSIHRRLAVALPHQPALHAAVATRLRYSRRITLRLRRIYPGTVTRAFASARARDVRHTLELWQARGAAAALAVAAHATRQPDLPAWLEADFQCIHRYEGGWSANTGNGYYGGLQMDLAFQRLYGPEFLSRYGTADGWPVWAQLEVAGRAYGSGRGFAPWPNTARACGLL